MADKFNLDKQLTKEALDYHCLPKPGKIQVVSTKPVASQHDLSLAYTPGVAAPCLAIAANPQDVYKYTNKGNLVAVISNGTAVLGLGNIGALASKPVMEGKGVLFKKFAGIDVFDIEIAETDIAKFVEVVAALEPTFGGINLEDIRAPACFEIEKQLKQRLNIPVFHDDQHGTAIVVAAGVINALKIIDKNLADIKIVVSGAGAAAIACLNLLVHLGAQKAHIFVCDSHGLIHHERENLDNSKQEYAQHTVLRTIDEVLYAADMFLGLSGPDTVNVESIAKMARDPLIFALANPTPEIMPELIRSVRSDAIIATGRSDYPNQINNALCFPYIFRGALDVGATAINEEMKIAAVHALANLATLEPNEIVAKAYCTEELRFGRNYLIPKPLDPRLIQVIAPAVALAAMSSGVATLPLHNLQEYEETLSQYVYRSSLFMRPVMNAAKLKAKRVIFCEGEEERVLLAVAEIKSLNIAKPILLGRPYVILKRLERLSLSLKEGIDFELINIENDNRYKRLWQQYYEKMKRKGITEDTARDHMLTRHTLIGAMLIINGDADGMICGLVGKYHNHLAIIKQVIGASRTDAIMAAMNALILQNGNLFIVDTHINDNPTADELVAITTMAADTMLNTFGINAQIALLSHSNFGSHNSPSAIKMRTVLSSLKKHYPALVVDGEMHADAAIVAAIRNSVVNDSPLKEAANLLVMPNIESASIAYNLMRVSSSDGVTVGPVLMGANQPVHILSPIATVRRIVNMTAVTSMSPVRIT